MTHARTCPICNRPLGEREDALRFRPFCSKRCANIDLGRWLRGAYAIPVAEAEAEAADEDGETAEGKPSDGDDAPSARH